MKFGKPLVLVFALALILKSSAGIADDNHKTHSPYSGQEKRTIKSLSEGEINGYLNGHGMGLAKAVELNQYPGPKHVLEISKELIISDDQRKKTESLYDEMHARAVELGAEIVRLEQRLDSLCEDHQVTDSQLREATAEIAALQGELRYTHMRAHLQMVEVLSEDQIKTYDHLRGYSD